MRFHRNLSEKFWRTNVPHELTATTSFRETQEHHHINSSTSSYPLKKLHLPFPTLQRRILANRGDGSTTHSISSSQPPHYLRFPRRRSYYRNHGYGKAEEDAAVGANWYVKSLPR